MSFIDAIDESPKKFDRVVAILTQLQSKRIVKAQDLADRFGVSLRTIYRDIKTLEASGIPIISEAGIGYSIMEGYKLPPVMFTRDEAVSFVAAEKLMEHFTDKSMVSAFQSAMFKIKSVLRWAEKDWIDVLDERILVQPKSLLFNKNVPNALEILMQGIVNKKQVHIIYHAFDADKSIKRNIEPIGLYHEKEHWYLVAYCHLRKDYRNFRADRITAISTTDQNFTNQHKELSFYLTKPEPEQSITIKIRMETAYVKYVKQSRNYYGFVSETIEGGYTEMIFKHVHDPEYFIRWFIVLADKSEILEPESMQKRLAQFIKEIDQQLKK